MPSSVGKITLARAIQKQHVECALRKIPCVKFLENAARDLCVCQRLVNFWDGDVVISRLSIPYRKPGFQEESFMKISLVSSNSCTSKIHFVVVFTDMAGDLGVMVEHSNNPFVFCNLGFQWSFSLTIVCKTAVGATEPPLRGVGSCGDGRFLNLFHYEVSYNRTDWRTHHTSKDLFVMGVVVVEVVVIENKF